MTTKELDLLAEIDQLKEQWKTRNEYNGWVNYETWLVNLWLMNDSQSEKIIIDMVEQSRDDDLSGNFEIETVKGLLVTRLRNYLDCFNPLLDQANIYTDLLGSAISEVDFYELADHYLSDY